MERGGHDSEYRALHYWVEKQLGKPMRCENCGCTDRSRYHWANLSGEYRKDVTDWKRVCPPCHRRYFTQVNARATCTTCINGHEKTPENTYLSHGLWKQCRICKREHHKKWLAKQKECEKFITVISPPTNQEP